MIDDMVIRSAYLTSQDDSRLRQIAHDMDVSKSDLIRAAIYNLLDVCFTPGIPVKALKEAIRSDNPSAFLALNEKLGVFRTVSRSVPRRVARLTA